MNPTSTHLASNRTAYPLFTSQKATEAKLMSTLDPTTTDRQQRRLLVPINASEESRWAIAYALRLQREGKLAEVILLNVGEPVDAWQVLRFRTQQEVASFQAERAECFIADASRALTAANVPWRGVFKQGKRLFAILDAAEELACDEIVMPAPKKGLASLISPDFVTRVQQAQRGIPVVTVDSAGEDAARTLH